jgi:hypothetical protein
MLYAEEWTMRRKRNYLIATAAGAVLGIGSTAVQAKPIVTFSIVASNGNWTAFASTDNSSDNAGLANLSIDIDATGAASITSASLDLPVDYGANCGFTEFVSAGADGYGMTAAQNDVYSSTYNAKQNEEIIQNFAKQGAAGSYTDSFTGETFTWSVPTEIASGTYFSHGPGTLSIAADLSVGLGIQSLDVVSAGAWIGPGNVSFDTVMAGTVAVVPEPAAIGVLAVSGIGALACKRKRTAN